MRARRSAVAVWVVAVAVLVPMSLVFWWVGGAAMCGEEVYNTPPGSFGQRACDALVHPVAPWAAIASAPAAGAIVLGAVALLRRSRHLLKVAVAVPFLVIVGGIFVFLAVF